MNKLDLTENPFTTVALALWRTHKEPLLANKGLPPPSSDWADILSRAQGVATSPGLALSPDLIQYRTVTIPDLDLLQRVTQAVQTSYPNEFDHLLEGFRRFGGK